MKWRDITDGGWPHCRERVLLYDPALGIMIAFFESGRGWVSVSGDRTWPNPTHWAPLLKPPHIKREPAELTAYDE